MTQTIIPTLDAKAVKRWSSAVAVDQHSKSYWSRKFIGKSSNSIVEQKTELETQAGEIISFDLNVQLQGRPTVGDDRLKGKEENLRFFTDQVIIDQTRKSVSAGGRMTRKRTLHDLRKLARDRLGDYWAKYLDQLHFMYLAGARGTNEDYIEPEGYTGHAGNAIQAPDTDHIMYGGTATSKATITTADIMSRGVIERAQTKVKMIRAENPEIANMQPVSVEGEGRYVLVMSPLQSHSLRVTDTAGWLEMNKALTTAEGKSNPIFKGGLGMLNNTVLHEHDGVVRFDDYGAGTNLPAARALFMGAQAAVCAYGTGSGMRFSWVEEKDDFDNLLNVASGTIIGLKKTRYNGKDFAVVAVDTYAIGVS